MSLAQDLDKEIQNGLNGKVGVIPVKYDRITDYIDIAKNTYYTIAAESGVGKSSCAQDLFILNVIEWYLANRTPDIKLSIIYFGMERKMYMYSAKWISRLIFLEQGIEISPKRILGRKEGNKLTESEYDLVQQYYERLNEWEQDDLLIAHQNSKNPSGISMYLEAFARKHGTIHDKDKEDKSMENILHTKTYTPHHPNHIVLVITDHIGILAPEKDATTEKAQIDKFSRTMREARDLYGFSPVIIQQLNRNLSDVTRQKLGDLVPKLSDIAGSSTTSHDSDVIIALFDPYRHLAGSENTKHGLYDLKRLRDSRFRIFYLSFHILKNSFDASGIGFGMAIHPVYGILSTLPNKIEDITDELYDSVLNGQYFLTNTSKQIKKSHSGFGESKEIT